MQNEHPIVSREEWLKARLALLAQERELTHFRDRLSEQRRALPWVRLEKDYVFESANGPKTFAQLFEGRTQLVMYHFMFAPESETPCKSCSFWADTFNGVVSHLAARDVTFCAISRAPASKLQTFAKRMGWTFPWYSSGANSFNYDFAVSFTPEQVKRPEALYNFGTFKEKGVDMPGASAFTRDERGSIFHTYSTYGRGIDTLNGAYQYIDLAPKGRNEAGLPHPMSWVRFHDEY
jgi:predicted dithiol-disulfide oxidoreductase (DUF899 family)